MEEGNSTGSRKVTGIPVLNLKHARTPALVLNVDNVERLPGFRSPISPLPTLGDSVGIFPFLTVPKYAPHTLPAPAKLRHPAALGQPSCETHCQVFVIELARGTGQRNEKCVMRIPGMLENTKKES